MNRVGVFGGPTVLGIGALDETGTKYVVESGDSPSKIAQKLTGSATRWKELIKANPQKKVDPATGNFTFLKIGESLNLPTAWQKPAATTEPAQPIIGQVTPTTGGGGSTISVTSTLPGQIIPVGGGAPTNQQSAQWVKGVPNAAVMGVGALALAGVAFFAMKK